VNFGDSIPGHSRDPGYEAELDPEELGYTERMRGVRTKLPGYVCRICSEGR
jgi:hypothetical protein